jgi:hypothetical protein
VDQEDADFSSHRFDACAKVAVTSAIKFWNVARSAPSLAIRTISQASFRSSPRAISRMRRRILLRRGLAPIALDTPIPIFPFPVAT